MTHPFGAGLRPFKIVPDDFVFSCFISLSKSGVYMLINEQSRPRETSWVFEKGENEAWAEKSNFVWETL